jgi:LmbE family N-acetylglucosaminyl deacetylase
VFNLRRHLSVLALGPHADDIELGCGATLVYLKRRLAARIHYVVFSDHFVKPVFLKRRNEITKSAKMLKSDTFACWAFDDTKFPDQWREIQARIETLEAMYRPDLIFAPRLDDNHQDHVVVAEAAARELRKGQALWHYEIKQFGQDEFRPNIFIDVGGATTSAASRYRKFLRDIKGKDTFAHYKVFILRDCMKSQLDKPFLNPELLLGTMKFRGMQVCPQVEYAEAFQARIWV